MTIQYFEDLSVGTVETSGQYEVTKSEIVEFASQWDPQPFHTDETAAEESLFGELVASGWHTAAIAMRLAVVGFFDDVATTGSPGADDLRWPTPVRPGDTLTLHIEIIEKRASESNPEVGIIKTRWQVFNQDDEEVFHIVGTTFLKRRGK